MLFTMPSWKQVNPPYKFKWTEKIVLIAEGSSETTTEGYMENYKNVLQDIQDQLNAEAEAVQIVLLGIDNDIYSTVDACPNACEMWKAIERLKQGESINVQDLKTNLYCEFGKFTSQDGESLESYYSRFYKMINELVRNQCDVTNHQVNIQFLLQLQPEWQRFVTLVKQSQELKTVSYHKLYDILKQHQNEVNEIRAKKTTATRNRGKAIVNSSTPTYDQEPAMVIDDDEMSKEKEIDKLMALISLSFKKIYKPTNNNLITSSNTNRAHQDNTLRINRGTGYNNHRVVNIAEARENVAKVSTYHKEKMLLCKQEEVRIQLSDEQADWRDDTDDEPDDQELEARYMYMAQIQEVTPDAVDNSGSIFDTEPLQKVQNDDDNYNVFANDRDHLEQPESVKNTYLEEQGDTNITIDSLDMCTNGETIDQDDDDHARERDLLASLINKLKCEIDESKNRNKLLESSNKTLVDKLKGEIKDFKTKNKSLESSNNYFKEANNKLSKTNQLMLKDLKKFQAKLESFVKTEFFKNAQRANPRLYDIGVIPTTSVSRPQLKSNQLEDRVMPNNSQGKKQEVEEHHRNFKFSKNKTSVTACNDSLNAKTSNVNFVCVTYEKCVLNDNHDICVLYYINGVNSRTKQPIVVPISTREPKRTMNQSVATPLKRTVASESTNQNPKSKIRKQYEQISKTCKWWYSKITPPGYKWKPKSSTLNVKPNVSMPLGNISRTTNISESITLRGSTLSNTPFSFNSFADRRDNSIHRPLWVLKAHDRKSQASNQEDVPQAAEIITTPNELDLLFSLMFDELLNGTTLVVSKSSTVNAVDAPDKLQRQNITQSTTTIVATDIPPLKIHTTP
ncbi:hypothetical protein Tco_0510490 [Tanacetum coccineum]